YVGNSGTSTRFLAAALCLAGGNYTLDGTPRMQERPIRDLMGPLQKLGAAITCSPTGCPPVQIGPAALAPGTLTVRGDTSSQFLSGLLMMLPGLTARGQRRDTEVRIQGELVSRPYVDMTLALMAHFSLRVGNPQAGARSWKILARWSDRESIYHCKGGKYDVEPDASSASYFLAAAAITGGQVCVKDLPAQSLQGDMAFAETVLKPMGCTVEHGKKGLTVTGPKGKAGAGAGKGFRTPGLLGIDVDLSGMPDMAQTLAVTALFAEGPTTIRGIANLRVKETDRIAALETELTRIGAKVTVDKDSICIDPGSRAYKPVIVKTYDDHRMAMSFALAGLKIPGMQIADPGCVAKTFPDFFPRWQTMLQGR
ncbi:MAG TPA: 3-phosphoshikimate 1-carboxyvinyltransferase, partial [Planctomycetota bacterium]|nr:3-phosphoshikimate 1-carboxyvinyltransferase [Planctomycetota bacterium]